MVQTNICYPYIQNTFNDIEIVWELFNCFADIFKPHGHL